MSKYKRILIIGSAGSGKTYLSNILSEKLDIEVTHLDKMYWLPNWERQPVTFCEDLTKELVVSDEWILDGNYIQTLDIRLEKADLVIFLKVNRFKCIASLFKRKRLAKRKKIERDDLADGCVDKLDCSFLKWAFTFNNDYAPKLLEVINKYPDVDLKVFNKREDALEFIENL
mgnify:FL=1